MRSGGVNAARQSGLTVLELIIAVSLMAVIVAVMAPLLHAVQSSWAAKEAQSESLANARAFMHHFSQHLSQALRVTAVSDAAATEGYIQFVTADGNEVRYEVGSDSYIQFGPPGSLADLAGPADMLRIVCCDGNDFTTAITDSNSIRFVTVEAAFQYPARLGRGQMLRTCVFIRTGAIAEPNYPTVDAGVAVRDEIQWSGRTAVIDSYRSSQGAYNPASPGSEAIVTVNAVGSSKIVLSSGAVIRGDAYIGPGGNVDEGIVVTGDSQLTGARKVLPREVGIPNLTDPGGPPFDGPHEGDLLVTGSTTVAISSNRFFNKIQLRDNARLIVDGSVTILVNRKLEMDNNATINLQGGSTLKLYIGNNADIALSSGAAINAGGVQPANAQIYMLGNNRTLAMAGNSQIHAVLQNPLGSVQVSDNAQLFGRMKAARLTGGGMIHVDLDCRFE
jgi:type II secretory pathway pseudopilin PulG